MITDAIAGRMRCPTCEYGGLDTREATRIGHRIERGELRCERCGASYPVEMGVPMLLPREALEGEDWRIWRDHLEKFQARREDRIAEPDRAVTRLARVSRPQRSFADFIGIEEGVVLDVGCGPGKFRFNFDPDRVEYIGMDPIALPESRDFSFIRGVAERVPFQDGTFTDVVVLAALDHFRDLDRFFSEARRVLHPDGRLHLLQSVHEIRGPVSLTKFVAHKVKDAVEERSMTAQNRQVPKHLAEFTPKTLLEQVETHFSLDRVTRYSARWYSPMKLFLTLKPKVPVVIRSSA
jgi:ubiquinone/menaquinone biosynthesis C-methylase UbiE/uncharacterized protein YbaR (Trm112 family)